MQVAFHRLEVAQIRPETSEAVSVVFAVPKELSQAYRFDPGQHLTLRTTLRGIETRRSYSICAGLDEGELRIAVKKVEDGVFKIDADHDGSLSREEIRRFREEQGPSRREPGAERSSGERGERRERPASKDEDDDDDRD